MDISCDLLEILVNTMRWGQPAISALSTASVKMYNAFHGSFRRPGRQVVSCEADGRISWLRGLVPCDGLLEDDVCVRPAGGYSLEEWTDTLKVLAWGVRHSEEKGVLKLCVNSRPKLGTVTNMELTAEVLRTMPELFGLQSERQGSCVEVAGLLPELRVLRVGDVSMSSCDLAKILPRLPNLEELEVSRWQLFSLPVDGLKELTECEWGGKLARLKAVGCRGGYRQAFPWPKLLSRVTRLTDLDLSLSMQPETHDDMYELFAKLPLQRLRLRGCQVQFDEVAKMLPPSLSILDLSSNSCPDTCVDRLLDALVRLPHLEELCLEGVSSSRLADRALARLSHVRVLVDSIDEWFAEAGEIGSTFVGTSQETTETIKDLMNNWAPMPPPQKI